MSDWTYSQIPAWCWLVTVARQKETETDMEKNVNSVRIKFMITSNYLWVEMRK